MSGWLCALQALTNLTLSRPGPGLPLGWQLARVRHVAAPTFQLTSGHALRIETRGDAGIASHRLRRPLRPATGRLTWRWRTCTPLRRAALRTYGRDDSPARVVLTFDDGRMLYYSWGNAEPIGEPRDAGSVRGLSPCLQPGAASDRGGGDRRRFRPAARAYGGRSGRGDVGVAGRRFAAMLRDP